MQDLPDGFQVDQALSQKMGATVAVNPATGKRIKWNAGGSAVPPGAKPRADYGSGAYEAGDGTVLRATKNGVQVLRGARVTAPAEQRVKFALTLPALIEAQDQTYRSERWGKPGEKSPNASNPYGRHPVARALEAVPFDGGFAARVAGGQDYQDYEQANRTIESAMLPVFSGAAVTDQEARRFIRANQPQIGDTPVTLGKKWTNRASMINAMAEMMGAPIPYPKVKTWETPREQPKGAPQRPITANAPRKGAADPFPGIRDGQFVEQGGVRYQRKGSQMVEVR